MTNNSRDGIADLGRWLKVPEARFQLFHIGVDFSELDPKKSDGVSDLRRRLGIPTDAFVVGSVMRLTWQKDPILWLEVAARFRRACPSAQFVILGDGPLRRQMLECAVRLQLTDALHMIGGVLSGLADYYRLFDALLLTSRSEGMPNVAIEAQYCGVPVVLSDVGGNREGVLPGQTGWLIAARDVDGYVDALVRLAQHSRLRERAAEVGPVFAKNAFDLSAVIDDLVTLYGWES